MILPFLKKKILGIDLGSFRIKAVEVKKNNNHIEVINFGIIPIINFKEIISYSYILEESISLALKDFLKTINSKTSTVCLSIQPVYTFSANFVIPNVPEKDLTNVIYFESQKQIPLSLDEVNIEYRYIPIESREGGNQWMVYVVGTPKNYFAKLKSILEVNKLKLINAKPEYFNFEPFFLNKTGNYIIIDLGHSYSIICLIINGKVVYGNKLKLGGYYFLDKIKSITGYSEEEVLDFVAKKGFKFLPEEEDLELITNDFIDNILIKQILDEINKIENNFLTQIDKVFWTGGLIFLPGAKEMIFNKIQKYQHELLLLSENVTGEKFNNLGNYQSIFIHALGCIF